ncbi:MAG TPA: ABC transporter ATP-binding protein [Candidatus Limnocylindrales bacterium]|nr:ABC transporter ATP-binding protein [Candidatus Limnocylindrales bacterium]
MLVCLSLAAVAEGIGVSSMFPLLGVVSGSGSGGSRPEIALRHALANVGLEPTIEVLLGVIVAGTLTKAALTLVAQRQIGFTVAHVATDLRLALLRGVLSARWLYYVRQPIGALANSFATEAMRAAEAYLFGATMISQIIETAIYVTIAAMVSWRTALAAAVVGAFSIGALSGLVRRSKRFGQKQTRIMRGVLGQMTDVLYSVKPLKAMGREPLIAPLLENETERLNRIQRRQVISKEAVRALQEPVVILSLVVGLYLAMKSWKLAFDELLVLAMLFSRALYALNKVQKSYQQMVASESAFWALQATIDESTHQAEITTGRLAPTFDRTISLRGVDFSYGDRPILNNVSLTIPAGEVVAVVGPSGAGKTTIADLMLGLVRPQRGEVYLDETPLAEVDLAAWRHMVGYVPQEMLLLHEDVMLNVTLGDPKLSREDAEEALRAAGAWDFVCELPQGMETPLGERGARLSGGQRQRIAIARALVNRPRLLVLDEATASLDPQSEAGIYATVRSLRGKTAILAISHQPGLLEVADHVHRLTDGELVRMTSDPAAGDQAHARAI